MSKSNISTKDIKILWVKSGNYCAFPGCRVKLAEEGSTGNNIIIGVMAHIKGEHYTSARHDPNMNDKERNSYENRILLCPTHHTTIDKDPQQYTVEILLKIKKNHESWVNESLRKEEINITFVELETITQFIASTGIEKEEKITVISPKDKIKKNQLSASIEEYIKIGMLKSKLVKKYIDENPDINFGERLKIEFANKYLELKESGMTGDEIFYELFEFAANKSSDFKKQAAALAVLTYLFEICGVFEE